MKNNYGEEGFVIGAAFGVAIGAAFSKILLFLVIGACAGYVAGLCCQKNPNKKRPGRTRP
jgi:large-conductance mechanosensitive channel